MVQPGEVREGMTVRTADGRKLGKVVGVGDVHFELEQGLVPIPRHDYLVEYRDVDFVSEHDVYLSITDHPLLTLEVDDDGGALPPRHHATMDAEPVNVDVDAVSAAAPGDTEPVRH